MTLTILRKYYQTTTRSEGFWKCGLSHLFLFVFFMFYGFVTSSELYFPVSVLSFSMLSDFNKIKLGVNVDLGNLLTFPLSKGRLFRILFAKNFFSEKFILLLSYLLIINIIHNFHISISFLLITTYTLYCIVFVPIDILSRRKAASSVAFKLVAPLTMILILPFMVNELNPARANFDFVTKFAVTSLTPIHYFTILGIAICFTLLAYYAFKKAYVKTPFSRSYIVKNFNKNYWY